MALFALSQVIFTDKQQALQGQFFFCNDLLIQRRDFKFVLMWNTNKFSTPLPTYVNQVNRIKEAHRRAEYDTKQFH